MARDSLSFEIRSILKQVKKTGKPLKKDNIPFRFMGDEQHVSIEVMPVHSTSSHFLILFKDTPEVNIANIKSDDLPVKKETKDKIRIRKLESELIRIREEMSNIVNDQELSNEELQTVNEELVSGSEELQSLNEELEKSGIAGQER
jgi:two-component system CheB/CheR fusion protein